MREIKFRAWDKERKELLRVTLMDFPEWWVSCDQTYGQAPSSDYGERNSFRNEDTDRHILMQYTGLKDKNGKEIYEGDMVANTNKENFAVVWDELGWAIDNDKHHYTGWVPERTEIIGNIYENPELLDLARSALESTESA